MSNPPPNPVAPDREELEGNVGTVPLLSGEPAEVGLGQEKLLYVQDSAAVSFNRGVTHPGIIMVDHQLGFLIARKVASISSSERPAIKFIALSCAAATVADAWRLYCGVSCA